MDIYLDKWVSPHYFADVLKQQLPPGLTIDQVYQIGEEVPSLQSQLGAAEYRVMINTDKTSAEIEDAVNHMLAQEHIPWQHQRDTGVKTYDLRPLINSLNLTEYHHNQCTLTMRLRADESGSGRPEQGNSSAGVRRTSFRHPSNKTAIKGRLNPVQSHGLRSLNPSTHYRFYGCHFQKNNTP